MYDFFFITLLLLALSLLGGSLLQKYDFLALIQPQKERMWLRSLTILVTGLLLFWQGYKYLALQMGMWDFGIYDSLLHIAATQGALMKDFRGGAFDHFSPAILILLPVYYIWDSPWTLMIFQALTLGGAGLVLAAIVRKYFPKGPVPLAFAAMYFLNPYFWRLGLYDFHIECLFPLVFFGAWLAYARHRQTWFVVLLLLSLLLKEDFAIPVAASGVFCIFRRPWRKSGVILLLGAGIGVLLILKVYFPLVQESGYWHYNRYELTYANILNIVQRTMSLPTIRVLLTLLLPFAFLPLFHWKSLLFLLLPTLFIQLASSFSHQNFLYSHYSSALIAVVPVVALFGLRTLRAVHLPAKESMQKFCIASGLCLILLSHVFCTELPLVRYYAHADAWISDFHGGIFAIPCRADWYRFLRDKWEHAEFVERVIAAIPQDSSVAAQNEIATRFVRHREISSLQQKKEADFYIFDQANYFHYDSPDDINEMINKYIRHPDYRLWINQNGLLIIAKKNKLATIKKEYPL